MVGRDAAKRDTWVRVRVAKDEVNILECLNRGPDYPVVLARQICL